MVTAAALGTFGALALLFVTTLQTGPPLAPTAVSRAEEAAASYAPGASAPAPALVAERQSPEHMMVSVYDPSEPVGMHYWFPPHFSSTYLGPYEGWAGTAFRNARRLDPPWWMEAGLTSVGATPGSLVRPLLWVDPWLAAAAASADHRWAERRRQARWKEAGWRDLPPEEQDAFRMELLADAPEDDHKALFLAWVPDHEAASLVALDQLAAASHAPFSGRAERLVFLQESANPEQTRAVAMSFIGPLGDRPLSPEERRLVEVLLRHEDPVVRGAMGLVDALGGSGESGVSPDARGLAVLDAAADRCQRSMGDVWVTLEGSGVRYTRFERYEDADCHGIVGVSEAFRNQLVDERPAEVWQDAIRQAAMACGRIQPDWFWAEILGAFDGDRWTWTGGGPIAACLATSSFERTPEGPQELRLYVWDERHSSTLR